MERTYTIWCAIDPTGKVMVELTSSVSLAWCRQKACAIRVRGKRGIPPKWPVLAKEGWKVQRYMLVKDPPFAKGARDGIV